MSDTPKAKNIVAIRMFRDDSQEVVDYFNTVTECLEWIAKQEKSEHYKWMVGEY